MAPTTSARAVEPAGHWLERSYDEGLTWHRVPMEPRPRTFVNVALDVPDLGGCLARWARMFLGLDELRRFEDAPAFRRRRSALRASLLAKLRRGRLRRSAARATWDELMRIAPHPRGVPFREGRPRSVDVEVFDVVAHIAGLRVAAVIRRVYAHLEGAPVEWAEGRPAKNAPDFEAFARRETLRLASERAARKRATKPAESATFRRSQRQSSR